MRTFAYYLPSTIGEAVDILHEHEDAAVLAGGTDLLLGMKARRLIPQAVVDIKRIPALSKLEVDAERGLTIGAAITMRQLERAVDIGSQYPAIVQGAGLVGSVQIRNRATLVGNICNAAPSADTAPPLLALGARVLITGSAGRRSMSLEDFFLGPGQTALRAGELVTAVQLPPGRPWSGSAYTRHTTREAMDIATAGVAVAIRLSGQVSRCEEIAIALGAVASTPRRARQAALRTAGSWSGISLRAALDVA